MTFLHPWFLVGVAAAGVPLILHFFARRRIRTRPFSSIVFLMAIRHSAVRWARVTQRWLLVLRIAAIVTVAIALATPSCDPSASSRTLVVVDGSASMGAQGGAVWRAAQDVAVKLIRTCPGRVDAGVARGTLHVRSAVSRNELMAFVRSLRPEGGGLDMRRVLEDAAAYATHEGVPVRLVLVSDFQPSGWEEDIVVPEGVEVWGAPIAGARGNLWLGPLTMVGMVRGEGMIEIAGVIHRAGAVGDSCVVSLEANGIVQRRGVPLADDKTPVSFRIPRPGSPLVEASMVVDDREGIVFDDRRAVARWSRQRCRVAILGPASQTRTRLAAALDPDGSHRWGFEVLLDSCGTALPDSVDVVVMPEALRPDGCAEAMLRQYASGAGVLLIAGEGPPTEEGMRAWRGVMGSIPSAIRHASSPITWRQDHPVLSSFESLPPRGFSPPRVDKLWTWQGRGTAVVSVGDDPLIVESVQGYPRALAFMTGLVPPWSDWSSRASFVPLIQLAVDYVAGSLSLQSLPIGAPALCEVPWPGEGAGIVRFPDGTTSSISPEEVHAGVARLRLGPFFAPGVYQVWKSKNPVALLEPVTPFDECVVGPPSRPACVTRWIESTGAAWPSDPGDMSTALLLGALALCVAEAWLARSLGRPSATAAGSRLEELSGPRA